MSTPPPPTAGAERTAPDRNLRRSEELRAAGMRVVHCMPVYREIDVAAAGSRERLVADWEHLADPGCTLSTLVCRGQPVCAVRNRLARQALLSGADVILWQDADVAATPEAQWALVAGLLATRRTGVYAAAVPLQTEDARPRPNISLEAPVLPEALRTVPTRAEWVRERLFDPGGPTAPFEVARVGLGLAAVRASVYRCLPRPWHAFTRWPLPGPGETDTYLSPGERRLDTEDDLLGEDFGFCDRVRGELRQLVVVDPRIATTHYCRAGLRFPRFPMTDDRRDG